MPRVVQSHRWTSRTGRQLGLIVGSPWLLLSWARLKAGLLRQQAGVLVLASVSGVIADLAR